MAYFDFFLCYDFSFRDLFVAGEHMDKDTMEWTRKAISAPVYDNWWQTGNLKQLKKKIRT